MLRLLTLGGLALQPSVRSGTGASLQELAILARLAAAGERGLTRAKLAGCFWPERDERHARHSLSQALHQLRRELAADELILGTEVLRLNPEYVTHDVGELQAAIAARDADRAAALYAGPFLDGVFLPRADEFERWAESERRWLTAAFARCLREAATSASAAGDHAAAAAWWRRAAATDPLDPAVALELVRELAAAGDRAGALREARLYEAMVRTELRAEPDTRLRDLVKRIDGTAGGSAVRAPPANSGARYDAHTGTADEYCARGRQCFHALTAESFAQGVRYLQRAIEIDPTHAEAHVTLGSLYVVLSQAERAGDPRSKAYDHCRRAAELDPELAEAPLFLAWASMLDEKFEEAEVLALRAVDLDPAAYHSHFVLGNVRLQWGLATGQWERCVQGLAALSKALELHPRAQAALMMTAALYTIRGQYPAALHLLDRAVEVERAPSREMQMIGALTLVGRLHLHRGHLAEARLHLEQALSEYDSADQLFAPYVRALTLCSIGDLHRFVGEYDAAVGHYTRGREILEATPALIGCGHLVVRLETRLAAAFHQLRMRREELRHAQAARAAVDLRGPYSFNWCWGVSEAELHYDRAVYHATCAERDAMLDALRQAVAYGWREVPLVQVEPAFEFCRGDPELGRLLDEACRAPPLPE